MPSLALLGWDDFFAANTPAEGERPARVATEIRPHYQLLDETGERWIKLGAGARKLDRLDLPAVGDWVFYKIEHGEPVLSRLLPRRTSFIRRAAGQQELPQVVAANVDVVFVVTALDDDFNPRRLDRYIATVRAGGAEVVLVANKADLTPDPEVVLARLGAARGMFTLAVVSAREGTNLDALKAHMRPGRTIAFVGSSGVGKSTIINALLGRLAQSTAEVREHDSRGKHTTTRRELFVMDDGVLVDTPGLRELQLWGDERTVDHAFPEIDAIAATCRFADCKHAGEPGCAVRVAEASGALDAFRVESWRKLRREMVERDDPRVRAEGKRRARSTSKSLRARLKDKGRGDD